MTKVKILLSTYNGERFLAEQIKSIQNQEYSEWELIIRDDGSTDKTTDIIKQFVEEDKRIKWLNAQEQENLGVIKSFYTLLKSVEADYYCFCDQDDVWLPEKLSLTLEKARLANQSKPMLVYTDLKVVDENLTVLHESMIKTQSDHANTELVQELTENTVTGGTMMINRALADLWQTTEGLLMHDWYLALLASVYGQLIYLEEPTQLYRQHNDNVLGARTLSKRVQNWIRPHKLFEKYWWLIQSSQQQAKHLLEIPLTKEQKELVEAFVTILDQPLLERVRRLNRYGFRKNRLFHTLVFRTLITTKFAYRRISE